jgi:preprotein translocase subunit SecD
LPDPLEAQIQSKDKLINFSAFIQLRLNLLSQTPTGCIGAKPMYLGFDLRGGVHFLSLRKLH